MSPTKLASVAPTGKTTARADAAHWWMPISPTLIIVATTALIGGLLVYYYLHLVRGDLNYKFIHFLFDYKYGLTRRSFEGEVFRHLLPPPYSVGQFLGVANVLLLITILVFLLIGVFALRRHFHIGVVLLLLVIASSPLSFKNQIYDQGRQDVFGLIFLELVILARLIERPGLALGIVTIGTLPLSLVHEGQLLLFVPAALVIATWKRREPRSWPMFVLPLLAFGLSVLVNWALPAPRIPYERYHAYIQSKAIAPPPFVQDRWLYTGVRENLEAASSELRLRLWPLHRTQWLDYAAVLATLVALALALPRTDAENQSARRHLILVVLMVAPFYVLLFRLTTDWARWLADFSFCFYFLMLCLVVEHRLRLVWLPVLVVASLQLLCNEPFGVEVPELGLGRRMSLLMGITPSEISTDYAYRIAHERAVRCFGQHHDYANAVLYSKRAASLQANAENYAVQGAALALNGEIEEGVVQLETALRLEPRFVFAHYYLGMILTERPGCLQEGITHLREALRLDPNCVPARQALDRLNAGVSPAHEKEGS
jgi:tetratricopeptide (TPR) repeat protein